MIKFQLPLASEQKHFVETFFPDFFGHAARFHHVYLPAL